MAAVSFLLHFLDKQKVELKIAEGKSNCCSFRIFLMNESYKSYITQHPEFPAPESQV
jgi:hypothetical protein